LLQGIHCLNPRLLGSVPEDALFRIYINALSQLVLDDHNRIFTSDGRLLRRIVRDRRYRGTTAADTIARWPSVRRGEERHIFPFDEEADVTFNSTLVYETAVLKTFAYRYLLEVPRDHPSRTQAARLLDFLELVVPVFPDAIPPTSVLREFIGGSGFTY
jgi:uridine kinase